MEPISILAGTLGAKFLEEGTKFLWSEAAKILDRFHGKKEPEVDEPAPEPLGLPARRKIDFAAVARISEQLRASGRALSSYGSGFDPISADDDEMLRHADELQRLIVQAYGIDAPELFAHARVKVGVVKSGGSVTGQKIKSAAGEFVADVETGDVEGNVTGQDIDKT